MHAHHVLYSLEPKKIKGRDQQYMLGYDLTTPDIAPVLEISGHIRLSDGLRSDMPTKIFPTILLRPTDIWLDNMTFEMFSW